MPRGRLASGGLAALGLVGVVISLVAAPGVDGVLGAGLALLMLAIAVVDARRFIIPDSLNAAALVLGLANAAVGPDGPWQGVGAAALRGLVLALSFWALRALYRRLRGRDGLGLGDVKLAAVAGVWLDVPMIPAAIEIAALSALAAYGLHTWRSGRPLRIAARLPFGLFLAPAVWLAWLLQVWLPV